MNMSFKGCIAVIVGLVLPLALSSGAHGTLITTTVAGDLIFEVLSGEGASSTQEFGFGTPSTSSTIGDRDVIFLISLNGGVSGVSPAATVNTGFFPAGSELDFYNVSDFGGTFFAFSSTLGGSPTASDLVVFADADNSLGFGGSVVEMVGTDNWILHLDDAASICCDDDDNEMVIRVYVDPSITPVPEPASALLYVSGLVALGLLGRRRRRPRIREAGITVELAKRAKAIEHQRADSVVRRF